MKNFLFRFWPVFLIFLVWFIFASPYILKGKVPYPSTYQVNHFSPWASYEKFHGPVKNGAMPDVVNQIYPWKKFTIDTLRSGTLPLWNPYSFSGTPHLANYQSAVLSPFNLLFFVFPFVDAWSLLVLLQPLLAGIFTYAFARSIKVGRVGATISSVSFMFCGFIVSWLSYATLGFAIAFLPLALFCIQKYFETSKFRFLILLSLTIPLSFFSGHFQISLYFLFYVLMFSVFKSFSTKNVKSSIFCFLYIFFGLLLAMPQILPAVEFYTQSLRSDIFQKGEVIPWAYLPTFLAPDFFGNPVTRNDWFGHYAEWNAYIGVTALSLAVYQILRSRRSYALFFLIAGVVSLLLVFQTPFLDLLIKLRIPVVSTSAVGRAIVLFSFSFAILAGFGFESLYHDIKKQELRKITFWLAGFLLVFSLLWAVVFFKLFIPAERIIVARNNLILPTAMFIAFLSLVVLMIFFGKYQKRLGFIYPVFVIAVLFVISFDMLRFAHKWQPFDPRNLVFPSIPTTEKLVKLSGHERSLGNYGAEVAAYYGLPSVEGYDPLYIRRYGQFIASLENGKLKDSARSVVSFPRTGPNTKIAVNLLGIPYIVHKISDGRVPWTFPFWEDPTIFEPIYKDEEYEIYKNKNALPRAFLVGKYRIIKDPQEAISTMFSSPGSQPRRVQAGEAGNKFNMQEEIVLEEYPGIGLSEKNGGKAEIMEYGVNKVKISVDSRGKSMLFLSDNFYPGWEARVDGVKTKILRANYSFRAVPVGQGSQIVEFIYRPLSFGLGVYLAFAGLFLALSLGFFFAFQRKPGFNLFKR